MWKDANGEVFETQETTLKQFFEDNPDHADGTRAAIRMEVCQGGHVWAGRDITVVVTKLKERL